MPSEAPADPLHLAVGVVTYERASDRALDQLVRSVELAERELDEDSRIGLYVVDNGAPTRWATRLPLTHLPTQGNVGFACATNRLLQAGFAGGADWVLCLNPDAVLHRRALAELLAMGRARPRALIEGHQFPEEHPKPYDPRTFTTPWVSGACLLVSRGVHAELGGFDEDFFLYCEDVDLSWRARLAGVEVLHCPTAWVGHQLLGRPPRPELERHTLLGARVLASKWGEGRFVRWAERELLNRGLVAGVGELPPLPGRRHSQAEALRVCDFRHRLSFARVRW
jgi:GT2 family glycosyltransferase